MQRLGCAQFVHQWGSSAVAEALRTQAAAHQMTEVDPTRVFPGADEVTSTTIENHFVFRTLSESGVLRCSYWLDDERRRCWLIAEASCDTNKPANHTLHFSGLIVPANHRLKGGNINGQMFGGLTASLMDMGCGMVFSSRHRGATAYLNLQYTAPVLLPATVVVRAELDIERSSGRKLFITGELHDYSSSVTAAAPPSPSGNTRTCNSQDQLSSSIIVDQGKERVHTAATDELGGVNVNSSGGVALRTGQVCCIADALFVARRS